MRATGGPSSILTEKSALASMKKIAAGKVEPGVEAAWVDIVKDDPEAFMGRYNSGAGKLRSETKNILGGTDSIGRKNVRWETEFFDADGKRVGKQTRAIVNSENGLVVNHALFMIFEGHRGVGKKMLADAMTEYRRMGVSRVRLHANIDVGGYAWARYGFKPTDAALREMRSNMRRGVPKRLRQNKIVPEHVVREVEDILDAGGDDMLWKLSDLKHPTDFGGEKMTLGKLLLLGSDWQGVISLSDSAAMERFAAYVGK
jgi:hypothetical protein